jgi:hypothetical protein
VTIGGRGEARQGEVHSQIGFKKGDAHQVLEENLRGKVGW